MGSRAKIEAPKGLLVYLFSLTTPISTPLGRVKSNKWNSKSLHRKTVISPKLSLNIVCRQQKPSEASLPCNLSKHRDPKRRALNLLEWSVVAVLKLQIIFKQASSHFNCVLGPIYKEDGPCPRVTALVGENNNNKSKRTTQSFLQYTEIHDFTLRCLSNLIPHVPGSLHNVFSGANAGKSRSFILRGVQSHTHNTLLSTMFKASGWCKPSMSLFWKNKKCFCRENKMHVLFPHQQYI